MSVPTVEEIGAQASLRHAGAAKHRRAMSIELQGADGKSTIGNSDRSRLADELGACHDADRWGSRAARSPFSSPISKAQRGSCNNSMTTTASSCPNTDES